MDNNIFPKIWKVIKFGYTIIATINVQIQTKDCVDSNVLLMRLLQKAFEYFRYIRNKSEFELEFQNVNWCFHNFAAIK